MGIIITEPETTTKKAETTTEPETTTKKAETTTEPETTTMVTEVAKESEVIAVVPVATVPETSLTYVEEVASGGVEITALNKEAEYIIITNNSNESVDVSGWRIVSEKGNQDFYFPNGAVLDVGQSFKVTSGDANGTGNYSMAKGTIWNNSSTDPGSLYNTSGEQVSHVSGR